MKRRIDIIAEAPEEEREAYLRACNREWALACGKAGSCDNCKYNSRNCFKTFLLEEVEKIKIVKEKEK